MDPGRAEVLELGRRMRMESEEHVHILALFGIPGEPCELEFQARRREMVATVVRLLRHAVEEGPALLILSDLDSWDAPSRQVIERLVSLPFDERVLREALLVCPEGAPERAALLSALARCLLETAPEHAEGQSRRAMKRLAGITDAGLHFRVCYDFGQILVRRGATASGLEELEHAMGRLASLEGPRPPVWRLRLQAAECLRQLRRLREARDACARLLETPEVTGSWLAQARCQEELATLSMADAAPKTACDHLSRAIAYHRFTGDRRGRMDALLRLAELDVENRAAWAQDALTLAGLLGCDEGRQRATRLLG